MHIYLLFICVGGSICHCVCVCVSSITEYVSLCTPVCLCVCVSRTQHGVFLSMNRYTGSKHTNVESPAYRWNAQEQIIKSFHGAWGNDHRIGCINWWFCFGSLNLRNNLCLPLINSFICIVRKGRVFLRLATFRFSSLQSLVDQYRYLASLGGLAFWSALIWGAFGGDT